MARKKKNTYGENIESVVAKKIWDEYDTSKRNQEVEFEEFDKILDMLECKRTEKEYEWLSDVFIPEYPSIHLTEASQWANQYFPSRDFVDVYLDGETEESVKKSKCAKEYINSMLNVKKVYHYQKYMRARSINSTAGYVYAVCSWRQKINIVPKQVMTQQRVGMNPDGTPIIQQVPMTVPQEVVIEDRFHYEVPDPRNVFTSNDYSYSAQDKEWITIRSEMSYEQLKAMEADNGYINLDVLKEVKPEEKTETAKIERGDKQPDKTQLKLFDILERFGKIWAIIEERDNEGYPVKIKPAYNDKGELDDKAELVESIVTLACSGNHKVLIRFQPTPFRTSKNEPFRPIVRGLNYIHPTKDVGMSDAKYAKELQVAINDTINLSNDRVKLATMPTLKVRRYALEDNDSIYFEPEHMMLCENPDDITEFQIRDNMQGALAQAQMFINKLQQVESIYPTTMGDLPGRASTTATAIEGANTSNNLRANYKSLTFEYTFLTEFYWVMLQMGYQFMHPETAMKIMGQNAAFFDPDADYHFQPVSSNIEVEYNKNQKVRNLDQMVGRLSGMVQFMPGIIFPILKMILMQFELMGQESQTIKPILQKVLDAGMNPEGKQGNSVEDQAAPMTSNQNQVPVGAAQEDVRQNASGLM
jgi:hypothetical protein